MLPEMFLKLKPQRVLCYFRCGHVTNKMLRNAQYCIGLVWEKTLFNVPFFVKFQNILKFLLNKYSMCNNIRLVRISVDHRGGGEVKRYTSSMLNRFDGGPADKFVFPTHRLYVWRVPRCFWSSQKWTTIKYCIAKF